MIKIPNLVFLDSLDFARKMYNVQVEEGEKFDFSGVHTCNPFPMLLISSVIRKMRSNSSAKNCIAANCENTYAKHMRFYKAMGIDIGRELSESYGNSNYLPITCLNMSDLMNEGLRIQDVIENKAKLMTDVLSNGNKSFNKWLKYILTEMMRNIPEHSKADSIWYCAQYWPSYDIVELAILDEGIGIKSSLLENTYYEDIVFSHEQAIKLALQPGISKTFIPGKEHNSDDEWANSGFGLYMVSELCSELDGSFIIASGDTAIRITSTEKTLFETQIDGTAIQIRIRPSKIDNYEEIARKILCKGESKAKAENNTIKSASTASKKLF